MVFHTPWIGSVLSGGISGGAETQVLMLARELARRGVSVAIIVFGTASEQPTEVDGIRIVVRPPRKKKRLLVSKVLEELKIWPSLWKAPSRAIVHRGGGVELGIVALYACLTRRQLVFATANVVDFAYEKMTSRRSILSVYRLGVRLADEIVVQTEEQVRLCEATFGRHPILIKSIEPLGEPQTGFPEAFLWVGRLVSYKRPLEYVELARALPEARFWMLAVPIPHHDDDQYVMESVMERSREVPNLELLEPRPHHEVQALMARAVASVNTAAYEGMPNVLLEAWSVGVPALVLTHDPDGVVTKHGLGGFADGSADKLAALARELWVNRGDRAELSQRCRAYIQANHAPDIVAARWLDVIAGSTAGSAALSNAEPEPTCAA